MKFDKKNYTMRFNSYEDYEVRVDVNEELKFL